VGIFELFHQIGDGSGAEAYFQAAAPQRMVGRDAVDASLIVTAMEVDELLNGVGNVLGRLDHLAIEIEHVEVAVGRVDKVAGPKPDIRRGQELYTGLGGMRLERRALGC